MGGGVDLRVRLPDLPVRADEVADALRRPRGGVLGRAVGHPELAVGVAQQREVELELLGEGGVLLHGVEARAQDLHTLVLVLLDAVAEPATLGRSTGRVRLGIEPEDDVLAAEIGQAARLSGVVLDLEIGSLGAGLEHAVDLRRHYIGAGGGAKGTSPPGPRVARREVWGRGLTAVGEIV